MTRSLRGRRIAVLAADGFEKIELTIPVAALRAAGAAVDIVSLRPGRIRGVNLHEPAGRVRVTRTLSRANAADYDGLFIPGGYISPDLLRQSAAAREFVRAFDRARQPIATFCHGLWVLASAGILSGRTLTSWPGIRDDMVGAGATWLDQPVVRDGHLITSRGPQDLIPFIRGMIDHFAGRRAPVEMKPTTSSPQRNEPPAVLLTAMKWVPRPSLRAAALSLGLVTAGLVAAGARRR